MNFGTYAALAVVVFIAGPVLAHLRNRGRAREVPFAALEFVPRRAATARTRARLNDPWLLLLRALSILALAVLGASPFVRCDRLSVGRTSGGNVALALVIDNSLSMRATVAGSDSRWTRARDAAEQLLDSLRPGDGLALIRASHPARTLLAPTLDYSAGRAVLDRLQVSDRGTDLRAALALAEEATLALPQSDRRVVLLSDLADDLGEKGTSPQRVTLEAPLTALSQPQDDCGIASAERSGGSVAVLIACSTPQAAEGRRLLVLDATPAVTTAGAPAELASAALVARSGSQTHHLPVDGGVATRLVAVLEGADSIAEDDRAVVALQPAKLRVAYLSDRSGTSASVPASTVLERALHALAQDSSARSLPLLPDNTETLSDIDLLVLDDPAGIGPESRGPMRQWLEGGGVTLALLGPRAARSRLGSTLQPLLGAPITWHPVASEELDIASLSYLGPEASSLVALSPSGRARLPSLGDGAQVEGTWVDGRAWLLRREVGAGLVLAAGLPASPELSDFPLRPGFLALLSRARREAQQRAGTRVALVGQRVRLEGGQVAAFEGGDERPPVSEEGADRWLELDRGGRYQIREGGQVVEEVVAQLDPDEMTRLPASLGPRAPSRSQTAQASWLDASRYVAWALLLLFAAELAYRGILRWRRPARAASP